MHCSLDRCNGIAGLSGYCRSHVTDRTIRTRVHVPAIMRKGLCSVEKCYMSVKSKGLCSGHYQTKREIDAPCYQIWKGMIDRCTNTDNKAYMHYGGRGIAVCERWLTSYDDFYTDMGNRPTSKHSIDRIDVNGNYEPDNCRWATSSQQNNNKRNNSPRPGVIKTGKKRWRAHMIVHDKVILNKTYPSYEEACAARTEAEKKYWK